MTRSHFEWDATKDRANQAKHGVSFRIFGAGYWRKGMAIYERENKVHG